MRVMLEISGNMILDRTFDHIHILARADAGAIADTENMGIDRLCRHAPPHV